MEPLPPLKDKDDRDANSITITAPTHIIMPSKGGDHQDSSDAAYVVSQEQVDETEEGKHDPQNWLVQLYSRHRPYFHLIVWLAFTGFLCAAYALQVPKGYDSENLILGLLYGWVTLYFLFQHIPIRFITTPIKRVAHLLYAPSLGKIDRRWRMLLFAFLVGTAIVATVFSLPETNSTRLQRLIALFGLAVFLFVLTVFSKDRKAIDWMTVSSALLCQFLLALFVFRSSVGHSIFGWLAQFVQGYLGKSWYGLAFLFNESVADAGTFAGSAFPAIIFFSATVQMLYHLGVIQSILARFAVIFMGLFHVSGVEAVIATASPFLGLGENALLIRPFLEYMTPAEYHQIMTSGFSTIAGSMLFAYMSMGVSGEALLASCIMSIPCSLAVSKIRYPETDVPLTGSDVRIPPPDPKDRAANLLHAASIGASIGIQIVLCIAANLITILSLLYAVNAGITWLGHFINVENLTLQLITGYLFVPIAWLIGADTKDLLSVGELMALKIWANEFAAYQALTTTYAEQLSDRSRLVVTYALCGFANLGSIGIQIGTLGALAPSRTADISRLAISAMLCGAASTWISAAMAGMLS
ncbi:Na+ dependent nucleoside transporter C-terminus-domain-containing protein [Dichotomocladium elegans]|nr:Na+ dependent nucleoside transporter C-terminus-domain-containing protein [Dichotomocladium elegans]